MAPQAEGKTGAQENRRCFAAEPSEAEGRRTGGGCLSSGCLLYTSDAADEYKSVDLGGRRIIKKKFFQAEDGIRDSWRSRGLGDVYKRQNDTRRTNGTENVHKSCENVDNPLRRVFHNMWIHCGKVCTGG